MNFSFPPNWFSSQQNNRFMHSKTWSAFPKDDLTRELKRGEHKASLRHEEGLTRKLAVELVLLQERAPINPKHHAHVVKGHLKITVAVPQVLPKGPQNS